MNSLSAIYYCGRHGEIEVTYRADQVDGVGFPTQMFCPGCPSGKMGLIEETKITTIRTPQTVRQY